MKGRFSVGRVVLLCVLCVIANTIRYAGVFNWFIIAGALLQHYQQPLWTVLRNQKGRRLTIAVLATFIVTMGTCGSWYLTLHVNEQQALMIREAGGTEDTGVDIRADSMARRDYSFLNADQKGIKGYLVRPVLIANWFSYLVLATFSICGDGLAEPDLAALRVVAADSDHHAGDL